MSISSTMDNLKFVTFIHVRCDKIASCRSCPWCHSMRDRSHHVTLNEECIFHVSNRHAICGARASAEP